MVDWFGSPELPCRDQLHDRNLGHRKHGRLQRNSYPGTKPTSAHPGHRSGQN